MTFWDILDTLLFRPLQLLFETIYVIANRVIGNPGLSIVVLSLLINLLVLPLYKRADAIQEEEKNIQRRLEKGVAHIKKTFRGDERMMMLQTYYRQNNYKPVYVLRSAISLLLQIPFFIAAYRFLSGLQLLNGVSFGPIADLGAPDAMLSVAGISVNVLPILMTAVNIVSCVIFTKGEPLKSKIQLYAMAVFFFIFLYTSPSGLVFYWTLNNIFSLVKTIFYKLKNPKRILAVLSSAAGIFIFISGMFFCGERTAVRTVFFVVCGVLMQAPLIYNLLKKRIRFNRSAGGRTGNKKAFLAGGIFLSVLIGILIPSSVISASPQEFIDTTYFYHPMWFVASSFCLALGIFVIWMGVFYWLAKPSVRYYFDQLMWILSGIAIVNYMFFGRGLGILSSGLKYENGLAFAVKEQLLNLLIVIIVAAVFCWLCRRWKKRTSEILAIGILATVILSTVNIVRINASVKEGMDGAVAGNEGQTAFTLSKTGKNVVVLMLDRAMGEYVPYIFNEKPELKEQFSGFVHYSNTVSFGGYTNFGVPAVFGGYEYTPLEMNKRDGEPLVSKHNEALKVMPVLFAQNGYNVTVCNPSYANYQWIPDLSIYDEYPEIKSIRNAGIASDGLIAERWIQGNTRNFFCYGILKSAPLCVQKVIYNDGAYNRAADEIAYSGQVRNDAHTATGISGSFMKQYNELANLSKAFSFTEEDKNTFLIMTNDITHEPMMLQEPNYQPSQHVYNTEYDRKNGKRFTLNGRTLKMETEQQVIHYHSNMAAMLQLGKLFDYMRKNGVYDNTRIILVSDHGRGLEHFDDFRVGDGEDLSFYYPLLMVKDFDSKGFAVSDAFMTNGDVPTLAAKGIIDNPRNPFTGKALDSSQKDVPVQYVFGSRQWNVDKNNGNTFLPGKWYSVHDDMRNPDNWEVVSDDSTLPEEN